MDLVVDALVVDANIVISCLISFGSNASELFFSDKIQLFAPEYLKGEIENHQSEILGKAKVADADFNLALAILFSRIAFIPLSDFEGFILPAVKICPDPNDVEYFALALKLGCSFWSNDKRLKEQKEVKVLSTSEILKLFREK